MQGRQKAGFLSPISYKITLTKEKKKKRKRDSEEEERRRRKKSNGYTPSFYIGYFKDSFWPKKKNSWTKKKKNGSFGDNIVKNPARRLYGMSSIDARWPETSFTTSKWRTLKDWQDSWKHINPFFAKKKTTYGNLQSFD